MTISTVLLLTYLGVTPPSDDSSPVTAHVGSFGFHRSKSEDVHVLRKSGDSISAENCGGWSSVRPPVTSPTHSANSSAVLVKSAPVNCPMTKPRAGRNNRADAKRFYTAGAIDDIKVKGKKVKKFKCSSCLE